MNKQMSVTMKLAILILFAVGLGAVMIALSTRGPSKVYGESSYWGTTNHINKSFDVAPGGKLLVDADVGDVEVIGGDSGKCTVDISMDGSQENLQRLDVSVDQENGVVRVYAKDHNHFHIFENGNMNVKFEIRVPKSFNVDLHTSGGEFVLRDIKGNLQGNTSGGDMDLSALDGTIHFETSGGEVRVKDCQGDLNLKTSGGDIRADNVHGILEVETSGGGIDMKGIDAKLDASTSGGNIDVSLNDNKGVSLETSGGEVRIHMPKTVMADVDAETTGGDVNCDLEYSGHIKDGSMRGKINGGGNMIHARSSGGDIVINEKF
jgi:DUF4097 and DUF4098 domain-containing protein YvlB